MNHRVKKGHVSTNIVPVTSRYNHDAYRQALASLERGDNLRRSAFLGVKMLENSLFTSSKLSVGSLLNADISYLRGLMSRIHIRGLLEMDESLMKAWTVVRSTNTLESYMEAIRSLNRIDFAQLSEKMKPQGDHLYDAFFSDLQHHISSVTLSSLTTHARYLHETHKRY